MSKRRLVITAVLAGQSQSEVARTYGVSQGWISKLMARYRAEGEQAFEPRSRLSTAKLRSPVLARWKSPPSAGLITGSGGHLLGVGGLGACGMTGRW